MYIALNIKLKIPYSKDIVLICVNNFYKHLLPIINLCLLLDQKFITILTTGYSRNGVILASFSDICQLFIGIKLSSITNNSHGKL